MNCAFTIRLKSIALICVAGAVFLPVTGANSQDDAPPIASGTKAPSFTTNTITGKHVSLKSLRGKVVLVDFWATWCGPCRMATPTLQSLYHKYHHNGLQVLGISVDDNRTVADVKPLIKQMNVGYWISASPAANQRIAMAYKVEGIPSQYLIDKKGVVRWSVGGYSPDEKAELSALIKKLLAEKS
jgi:thiol-disulfide isomerase/thioredoxin